MNTKLKRLWTTKTKDDEWWSSFVTSPIAILLNYFIVDCKKVTPNKITLLSFIVALVSAVFIVMGGTTNFVVAAVLIHLSHVLDCMDGQMARYRNTPSLAGCFFDKLTDQIQVALWFAAVGYAAFIQSQSVLSIFLAFAGVAFYNLRGYTKYVSLHTLPLSSDALHNDVVTNNKRNKVTPTAGLGFGLLANFKWFIKEQRKVLSFNEGVFIFMLSLALILNQLIPMLWVFAISQVYYGIMRSWQRGMKIKSNQRVEIEK